MIVTIHLKCKTWKKQSAFGNQDIDCFMQFFLYFMGGPKHVGELSHADSKAFLNQKMLGSILLCQV